MKNLIKSSLVILLLVSAIYAGPSIRLEVGRSTIYSMYFLENNLGYTFKLPTIRNIQIASETYGSFLVWAEPSSIGTLEFAPIETVYKIGQKLTYNHVYLRFEHYCAHPVAALAQRITVVRAMGGEINYYNIKVPPYWWTGAQEIVSIGFEYTFK